MEKARVALVQAGVRVACVFVVIDYRPRRDSPGENVMASRCTRCARCPILARIMLLATMKGLFPFLEKLFADSAYPGPLFANGVAKNLPCLKAEIIKRSDQPKVFAKLPKGWIVERTIAWLNRCRRLAKDWENLNRNALAFLKLASIPLILRKLCNR